MHDALCSIRNEWPNIQLKTLYSSQADLNLLVRSHCLRLTAPLWSPASTNAACLACSLLSLVFKFTILVEIHDQQLLKKALYWVVYVGEVRNGKLCESCGNPCHKQLIKLRFISCGVTSINHDSLKWPLKGEINHCLSRRRKWTSVRVQPKCLQFVTNNNLQRRGVRRGVKTKVYWNITDLKTLCD